MQKLNNLKNDQKLCFQALYLLFISNQNILMIKIKI